MFVRAIRVSRRPISASLTLIRQHGRDNGMNAGAERGPEVQIADWEINESVRGRPRLAARHAAFARQHAASGALGALAAAGFAIWTGPLDLFETVAFGLLAATLLPALLLRATGRLEAAFSLSSFFLAALVGWLCLWTGGVDSFVVIWLAIVPLEAALSASRRSAVFAAAISAAIFGGLAWMSLAGALPPPRMPSLDPFLVRMVSITAAIIYAAALAMRTQRAYQRAEDAADAEEARYRMVADNASDLITRHAIDGTVLFATPAAGRLLGIRAADFVGTRYQDVAADDAAQVVDAMRLALRQGGETTVQFSAVLPSGARRCLETRFRATGGALETSLVGVTRDITDRQTAADQMAQARDLADRANRAKSAFLRSMSHELRTPLNAIIGFAQIIRTESFGPLGNPRYVDCAETIGDSGKSLLRIVTDVLRMSEIEGGDVDIDIEETDLAAVIAGAREDIFPLARRRRVTLDVTRSAGLPLALADARAAGQALRNILENAIEHAPAASAVRIVPGASDGETWIEISDTGPGIPAADLDRMVLPFERRGGSLEGRPAGAGVGLAIARALMLMQRGTLTIDSREGEGTRVRLTFPAATVVEHGLRTA